MIGMGWLVLAILSPFYHPYARLWLPFEGFHWVAMGGLIAVIPAQLIIPMVRSPIVGQRRLVRFARRIHREWPSTGG